METNKIYDGVKTTLVDVLDVAEDDVSLDSTLVGDLGAESIDFLDISFRLEKKFGIKIRPDEAFLVPTSGLEKYFDKNGFLTKRGITKIREDFPYIEFGNLSTRTNFYDLHNRVNVRSLVNYIQSRVNQGVEA